MYNKGKMCKGNNKENYEYLDSFPWNYAPIWMLIYLKNHGRSLQGIFINVFLRVLLFAFMLHYCVIKA